jgi:hypothetical protein
MVDIYFSDFFKVRPGTLAQYGAFNVSLVRDLPLFIDPFLLFNSKKRRYRALHEEIITYVRFLRDRSAAGDLGRGHLQAWFMFSEVRQTWLGYSQTGNRGSGLGSDFAGALNRNLNSIFTDFGSERVTLSSHLEKLCLIQDGVGRDNISDFTTNLIKPFLLEYTQTFALEHLKPAQRRRINVERARFDYETQSWAHEVFELPWFEGDFVLLTPRDLLTKDETWINRPDLLDHFEQIASAIPNEQLRAQVNDYFVRQLTKDAKAPEKRAAAASAIRSFPLVLEHYIRYQEDHGDQAKATSSAKVKESEALYVEHVRSLVDLLNSATQFYQQPSNTLEEARARVMFLKDVIENKGGHRLFYWKGRPLEREGDLQILYRLTWFGTPSDVSREVNDGRGPVDFKLSRGAKDKSLVEMKLASNTQLKRNLLNQLEVYQRASDANRSLKVIIYFSASELERVRGILRELKLDTNPDVILIDARADNKPSGSKAA